MKKRTERLIFGIGSVAAATTAAVLATSKITKTLVDTALAREQPQKTRRITGNQIDKFIGQDVTNSISEYSQKLEAIPMRDVEITADDGTRLVGHYYPCENPERIILAMHGWRSKWSKDFGTSADFMHNSNCDVLFIEQRGQGNSGGDYMGFGMTERFDCKNWVEWLAENTENLPIFLLGVSMGAATVMMASDLELDKRVKGIIADCGYTSANKIFRHVAKNTLHVPYSIKSGEIDSLCEERINYKTDDWSTTDSLKNTTIPVLFIHGTADTFVPVEMTYENYMACASPKKLLIVPGAAHGCSYAVEKDNYEKTVLEFFSTYGNWF